MKQKPVKTKPETEQMSLPFSESRKPMLTALLATEAQCMVFKGIEVKRA